LGLRAIAADRGSLRPPIHGHEWDTGGRDLQYACTFELPKPIDCLESGYHACDCIDGRDSSPICIGAEQKRGKAYPTPRELRVAKALGNQAVVGSICASSPDTAYKPFMERLADKMAEHLVP
jgi:hypothetical protein